jgi:hypothetical protein
MAFSQASSRRRVLGLAPAQGGALHGDAVSLVQKAIEDGLGQGGIGHGPVPGIDRQLAGDQGGAELGAVLDHLQEIAALLDRRRGEEKVIQCK